MVGSSCPYGRPIRPAATLGITTRLGRQHQGRTLGRGVLPKEDRRAQHNGPVPDPIRVLIADDQRLLRAGFRVILESEPGIEVVGEAADGLEAVELVTRLRPDVVLMDIRMPQLDGLGATERLMALPEPPRVVVLTTFDLNEYVIRALRAGAYGFLLKDAPASRLVTAVRAAAGGDALIEPSITRRLVERFAAADTEPAGPPAALRSLTERESEVLRLVARGLSNAEIAAELVVAETTVKTHVARMLTKLGLRDRVQAVVLAYESGFVPRPRGEDR
jgi:DNA-binding NarL/FixJ family response regulator